MLRLSISAPRCLTAALFLGVIGLSSPSFAANGNEDPVAKPASVEKSAKAAQPDSVEKRITDLHAKFHITEAQEAQWTLISQEMRDSAKGMDSLIKERTANAKTMTAIDDLQSYEKLAAAHEESLKAFIPLFQTLYASMSDSQKKDADATFQDHGKHDRHAKT
jgi:hypothetical protein